MFKVTDYIIIMDDYNKKMTLQKNRKPTETIIQFPDLVYSYIIQYLLNSIQYMSR